MNLAGLPFESSPPTPIGANLSLGPPPAPKPSPLSPLPPPRHPPPRERGTRLELSRWSPSSPGEGGWEGAGEEGRGDEGLGRGNAAAPYPSNTRRADFTSASPASFSSSAGVGSWSTRR